MNPIQSPHAKRLQTIAVLFLAVVGLCVFMSIRASNDAAHSLGPQALAVVGSEAWIADERGLVVTDSHGEAQWQRAFAELGVKGISTMVAVDHERVLLSSRDDTLLKLVSAVDAHLLRDIPLQIPADMAGRASHVLWMATRPVGEAGNFEIAVATGGDHTVLRFSDEGKFLARTKEGMYRYTNGIWFADGGWWTTDTNRFYLRKLDPESLAQTEEIRLSDDQPQRFLGEAFASHGNAIANGVLPLATVARFQNGMIKGRVVDVFRDGSEKAFPLLDRAEPMDLGWLDNELLVVEGSSGTVLRFTQGREALGEFGDARLRERFAESHHKRVNGKRSHAIWLAAAIGSLLLALSFLLLARRTTARERETQPALPLPDGWLVARLVVIAMWPQILMSVLFVLLIVRPGDLAYRFPPLFDRSQMAAPGLAFLVGSAAIVATWSTLRLRRQLFDPKFEPLFNYSALLWLQASRQWRSAVREGELPQEIIASPGMKAGMLLLTTERLFFFRRGIKPSVPDGAWERSDIVAAEYVGFDDMRGWRQCRQLLTGARFTVTLREGRSVEFRVGSPVTARRMAAVINLYR